ncbi:MAG: hypothetical protein IOC82_06600 [Aestuariivirga sp.]|nr:hypothetical protein [Aestuariivirga sp.]
MDKPALSVAEVVSLAEFVARRAEKFGSVVSDLEAGVCARAAETAESLARAGFTPKDQEAAAHKAAAQALTRVTNASSETRWETLRELNAAADSLSTTSQLWASPVTVLARAGLGSPERTAYMQQLTGAASVELRQMAAFAAASNNKVLGAALVSIVDRMPAKSRPFSANELADTLVGKEVREMQDAIAAVRNAAQRAIVRNREFERGRVSPLDRVKLALNNPNKE